MIICQKGLKRRPFKQCESIPPPIGVTLKQLVLPIDIENPYRLSNCLYRYISIYIGFLATNF